MSGAGRGAYFMPEVGDEVVLGFDRGQFDHPYVLGFLWNGRDTPPRTDAQIRVIRSVNGHEIAIHDPSGADRGYIRITDARGNQIELASDITITGVGNVRIDGPTVTVSGDTAVRLTDGSGSQIVFGGGQITMLAAGVVTIGAPAVIINGRVVAPVLSPI